MTQVGQQIISDLYTQKEKSKMFKAIKDNKIIAINETGNFPCMNFDEVIEDTEHSVEDYEHYKGVFVLKSDIPAPTKEEISEQRRQLYISLVDPLTSQIQRLRDEEQTEGVILQIESLKNERSELVKKIKEENPYPKEVETNENLSLENW